MSSKSNGLENGYLLLLFNNSVVTGSILDDVSDGIQPSVTQGSLYVALHTADPGEAGSQNTSEATFGGYARQAVARSGAGWTVSANQANNTSQIAYTTATATNTPQDIRFFSIGTDATGAGNILYYGHLGDAPKAFTAEADTDILTVKNHTFVDDDEVFIFEVPGETLPTGLSRGLYFVITPTGDTFQVETTIGGGAVNFTTDGAGYVARVVKKTVDEGDTFSFEASQLNVFED